MRPRQNCLFYTDRGKCTHLDRGLGLLYTGKICVLHKTFVGSCTRQVRQVIFQEHKPVGPDNRTIKEGHLL